MREGIFGQRGPRQAGKAPEGKREGFFLKNPDAKEMHEANSQEGKCLVYVVSCGNQDLDWVVGGRCYRCLKLQKGRPPVRCSCPCLSSWRPEGPLSHKSTVCLLPQTLHL